MVRHLDQLKMPGSKRRKGASPVRKPYVHWFYARIFSHVCTFSIKIKAFLCKGRTQFVGRDRPLEAEGTSFGYALPGHGSDDANHGCRREVRVAAAY